MANNFWKQMNRRFNRIHFRDTEIKTRGESFYINPTMKFIIVWAVFLIIIVLFFVIVKPFSNHKKEDHTSEQGTETSIVDDRGDQTATSTVSPDDSQQAANSGDDLGSDAQTAAPVSVTVDPADGSIIKRNEYPAVNSFAESYLNAVTSCDYNVLSTMVKDPSLINIDELKLRLNYATKYSNPECYTAPGLTEGAFVVYVVVNTQIPGVNVQPLSIHQFYLLPTSYGGYVHDNTMSDNPEILSYIKELNQNPEIVKVFERVEQNNTDSAAQDETLKQFYEKLNSAVSTETEGSTSEESVPEESTSEESVPEGSTSEESVPEESTSEESVPEE